MEFVACKECVYHMRGECDLYKRVDGCSFGVRPIALDQGTQHPNSNTEQSQLEN